MAFFVSDFDNCDVFNLPVKSSIISLRQDCCAVQDPSGESCTPRISLASLASARDIVSLVLVSKLKIDNEPGIDSIDLSFHPSGDSYQSRRPVTFITFQGSSRAL